MQLATLIPTFLRTILALILALLPLSRATGQDYRSLDSIALSIPDSVTQSVPMLSNYIMQISTADTALLRIAFAWIARHIHYDLELMEIAKEASQVTIEKTLQSRKTICQGYSDLFHNLLKEFKIESFIVTGITKDIDGTIDENSSHAWVAARVSRGSWLLYDPTWASGYIRDAQFVPSFKEKYFQTPADILIKTHLPIDPIWQLLNKPFTYEEFVAGVKNEDPNLAVMHFTDSIDTFLKASKLEAAMSKKHRALQNGLLGPGNGKIRRELNHLDELIAVEHYNGAIERYNLIIQNLNLTFGKKFTPAFYQIPKQDLTHLIQSSRTEIEAIDQLLVQLTAETPEFQTADFRASVEKLHEYINFEGNYLKGYLKRPRIYKFLRM